MSKNTMRFSNISNSISGKRRLAERQASSLNYRKIVQIQ